MSTQQLTLFTTETAQGDRLKRSLYGALHSFSNSESRWAKRKEKGLTDKELSKCIGDEFGIWGGYRDGSIDYTYQGGPSPKFWADGSWPGKPTLQGEKLIAETRQILEIPYP